MIAGLVARMPVANGETDQPEHGRQQNKQGEAGGQEGPPALQDRSERPPVCLECISVILRARHESELCIELIQKDIREMPSVFSRQLGRCFQHGNQVIV
jgi:hypothetical protein